MPKKFLWIFLAAVVGRLVVSVTYRGWNHPDEWAHTVELGNFLASGLVSHSEAFVLHTRNLTWPMVLSWVISFSNWISGDSVFFRLFSVRSLTAVLSLVGLLGCFAVIRKSKMPENWQLFSWAVLALPWFTLQDSVRPSTENLSQIFFWITLGLLAYGRVGLAGVTTPLIGIFRYPSGLFSAGIFIWMLIQAARKKESPKKVFFHFIPGVLLGLILGSLADWIYYGRPLESLWMYLQYNVFTGLSSEWFGDQPASIYLDYFHSHWVRFYVLIPLLPIMLLGLAVGIGENLKNWSLIFLPTFLYLIGHVFLTGHKEPRFMDPVEEPLMWLSCLGLWCLSQTFPHAYSKLCLATKKFIKPIVISLLVANGLIFLRSMWADNWKRTGTYEEVSRHIENVEKSGKKVCAVITIHRPISVRLPWSRHSEVPVGFFPAQTRNAIEPSSGILKRNPVLWSNRSHECEWGEKLLLHLTRPHAFWSETNSCEILDSGILKWAPRNMWAWLLSKKGMVSGPWYSCPSEVVNVFENQRVRKVVTRKLPIHKKVPPYGAPSQAIKDLLKTQAEPGITDGTFSDW